MRWFSKETPPVAETVITPDDHLREADAALRVAEREFAEAHLSVNQFYARHREFLPIVDVAGKTMLNIRPPSPELAALLSRENRSNENRNRCMRQRAELMERYRPQARHVAGQLVSL